MADSAPAKQKNAFLCQESETTQYRSTLTGSITKRQRKALQR